MTLTASRKAWGHSPDAVRLSVAGPESSARLGGFRSSTRSVVNSASISFARHSPQREPHCRDTAA